MTTEEINKAANEYQERIYTDVYEEGSLAEQELQCLNDFKAGADFTNKYWQEKTRWIPVEEKLPIPLPFEDVGEIANGDLLLLKHIGYGSIEFGVLRELNNKKYFELPDCGNCEINEISHWKEIEL